MRLTDYEVNREEFMNANNKLIDELKLKEEFKIKQDLYMFLWEFVNTVETVALLQRETLQKFLDLGTFPALCGV